MQDICQRDAVIVLDAEGQRIRLKAQDFTIKYIQHYQELRVLGGSNRRFPTYKTMKGSMTIHAPPDVLTELFHYHNKIGFLPKVEVKVNVDLPPSTPYLTLCELILTLSSPISFLNETVAEVSVTFTANKIIPHD